ncbi:MAG: LCP family protein [Candidatus Gracilibacteria bacterium]|jgi:LCP family protein required for cell wall assembly
MSHLNQTNQIPEYNVIHIGPESLKAAEPAFAHEVKRVRIARILSGVLLGMVFLGIVFSAAYFRTSLKENDSQITALIDEVGALSQANFALSEQVNSQEAVLQSIERDFTGMEDALKEGNDSAASDLFAGILSKISGNATSSKSPGTPTLDISDNVVLSGVDDSTFDIMLLGTNGSLTDTIMVASVNESKKKVTVFSIPRDLYINGRRINEYYNYYGVAQLERMVMSVTGLEMDRYLQVDLEGFKQVVDTFGGLDVYVDKALYDGLYPNSKGGYDPYSIEVGQYHMSGEEALKYARSRESTSDFDRAARQQKVLTALRTKVMQLDSVKEIADMTGIFQTALSYAKTDVNLLDAVGYYYDYRDYDISTGFVLSNQNYLYSMINQSGAYILLPKTGDFTQIQEVISKLVN